jgi:hypothetical protein
MTQPTDFISYSQKDETWKDRLVTQLGVLAKQGQLDLWDDRCSGPARTGTRRSRQLWPGPAWRCCWSRPTS